MSKNVHDGHRLRLKEKFIKNGLVGFNEIELIEFVLTYAIPRADVNPTAHALLERFGSVANVFDASVDELCKVNGIGEHTAILISMVPELFRAYAESKSEPKHVQEKSNDFYKLLLADAKLESENEAVWLYLFDAKEKLTHRSLIHRGSVCSVSLNYRSVIEPAMHKNTASVVIMHNHPDGSPYPSTQDIETTRQICQIMSAIGIPLREHYIVAQNRIVGIIKNTNIITIDNN